MSASSSQGQRKTRRELLEELAPVKIDDTGTFKYVLIEAYADVDDKTEIKKLLVRGFESAEYHADIYDEVESKEVRAVGLDCQCLGGGRIYHEPKEKYIKVYGYSVGFGKADHSKTRDVLKAAYPDYNIGISDEGY